MADGEIEEEKPTGTGSDGEEGEGEGEGEGTEIGSRGTKRGEARNSSAKGSTRGSDAGGDDDAEDAAAGDVNEESGAEGDKAETKAERKARLAKEKEEAAAKKKADAEQKKAAAAQAAEEKKQRKMEEKERKKLQKQAQTRTPTKRMPKATVLLALRVLALLWLGFGIAALALTILAYEQVQGVRDALEHALEVYCLNKGLQPGCLLIPEMVFVPYTAALAWAAGTVVAALLLLHGAIFGNTTASLSASNYMSGLFMLGQIALGAIILVTSDEYASFVDASMTDTPSLSPRWAADLAGTVETLWESPCDGKVGCPDSSADSAITALHTSVTALRTSLGCDESTTYFKGGAECFESKLSKSSLRIAIVVLVPIVLQVPAIYMALVLQQWVVDERGLDLFTQCRLPYGLTVCLLGSVLFALIFGTVLASLPV